MCITPIDPLGLNTIKQAKGLFSGGEKTDQPSEVNNIYNTVKGGDVKNVPYSDRTA